MKKKILSLILIAAMLLSIFPITAFAGTTEFDGVEFSNATYKNADNGDLILTYNTTGTLTIPDGYRAIADILVVGGGASGSGGQNNYYGNGGGGGKVTEGYNITLSAGRYDITAGQGGTAVKGGTSAVNGKSGGASSIKSADQSFEMTANGGQPKNGAASTSAKASDGTGGSNITSGISGDKITYGANGLKASDSGTAAPGAANTGNGGQGGYGRKPSGAGGSGVIVIRIKGKNCISKYGSAYQGTETATLFPDNKLEIVIENKFDGNNSISDGNVLYIGTADSSHQFFVNELAKECNVRHYMFSQSKDGYYAESEYDSTNNLTQKGNKIPEVSHPAAGTADTDIVATKFVYALYKELIEKINLNDPYDKIFLSFNSDFADGINSEDDCLNVTKYADALGNGIIGKTDAQLLDELKETLDSLYSEGKIVWITPGARYPDGYISKSKGNFSNYVLGGYGYKNPVQMPQETDSNLLKRFIFGTYDTLLVDDTLPDSLTIKDIIPQIEEDGIWYDIPDDGYIESMTDTVIKANVEKEPLDGGTRIKASFDISAYREWMEEHDQVVQPALRVKIICEASDEFIQAYTGEEHPDFDDTKCTYTGTADPPDDSFEFRVKSPEIKTYKRITNEKTKDDILTNNGYTETDVWYAEEGEQVEITVYPGDGYILKEGSLKVNYQDGGEQFCELTETDTDKYSFIMPGADVTVTAEFAKSGAPEITYTIVIPEEVAVNSKGVTAIGKPTVKDVENADGKIITYTASGTDFTKSDDNSKTVKAAYYTAYTDADNNTPLGTESITVYDGGYIAEENLTALYVFISDDEWEKAENGTYTATVTYHFEAKEIVTIASVLPEDFPSSDGVVPENAWASREEGTYYHIYRKGDNLCDDGTVTLPLSTVLTETDRGYTCQMTTTAANRKSVSDYTFILSGGVLTAVEQVVRLYQGPTLKSTNTYTFVAPAALGETYTVTFDTNGHASFPPLPLTGVISGSTISAPIAPVDSGYTFDGWYKEAACTNAWNFDTDTVTADTTLYAKWTMWSPK